jgi:ADP-heptose:LPS heptosyltransferase
MGLGDELMAKGLARAAHARTGKRVKVLGQGRLPRWHDLWADVDYIARPHEQGDFAEVVSGPSCRPNHTHFTRERWHYDYKYRAVPAEFRFTQAEREFGRRGENYVIVEPHIKHNASPNKDWGWLNWNKLVYMLHAHPNGIPRVAQVGPRGTATLQGVELIETPTFRHAAAVLAHAVGAVLPEGGLHHAAAAVSLPAVVIFGGFTPIECTGYVGHVNIGASSNDACGMRQACRHCEDWMRRITPVMVAGHARSIFGDRVSRPVVA